ncbi:vacuolar iron transporter homolog 4-like [Telopea speciosissima]|uniref:vacuolar iron transporter homolog 4-like n=1 Tax=Telopea speciosissima TaxID=54955 RepID=UPI001CC5FBD3|nr:vacuolar iron transporter homolog 4-like [Telopea speciosissima]
MDELVRSASLIMLFGAVSSQDSKLAMIIYRPTPILSSICWTLGRLRSRGGSKGPAVQLERAALPKKKERKPSVLPNLTQAETAIAVGFYIGVTMPLLAAWFIWEFIKVRLGLVAGLSSIALLVFGGVEALLGRGSCRADRMGRRQLLYCVRVLFSGWFTFAIIFGLTKLIGSIGLIVGIGS